MVNYVGAHLDPLGNQLLPEDVAAIDVLGPYSMASAVSAHAVTLKRCHLECLDAFHNHRPVWVFSLSNWTPRDRLFLSTKIEVFADIWGPLWRVIDDSAPTQCRRFAVGYGHIFRWKSTESAPPIHDNETFCHWVSNTPPDVESDDSSDLHALQIADRVEEAFKDDNILLIGAAVTGREQLETYLGCPLDVAHERELLCDQGKVRMLGTIESHLYSDSTTFQLQASYSGVGMSGSKQYKRQSQSLKKALVEVWMTTPELRDWRILHDFYGIEVSMCTQNAQRVQLGRILGLWPVRLFLRSFDWGSQDAHHEYSYLLGMFYRNTLAERDMWKPRDRHRAKLEQAIFLCLRALEKTGINHKNHLDALLCSDATSRPELVSLKPKQHSWIGILKDTEDSCSMVVLGNECLEFNHKLGSLCGDPGLSVLRTGLTINSRNMPPEFRKRSARKHDRRDGWRSRWSVRGAHEDRQIWLGKQGNLRFRSCLFDGALLMKWEATPMATTIRNLLDPERPHREYIENTSKEARGTRPIPLFIMSNNG